MAVRDREWPGYTIWYCCQDCGRLWTYQGLDVVALDLSCSLGPASVGKECLLECVRFAKAVVMLRQRRFNRIFSLMKKPVELALVKKHFSHSLRTHSNGLSLHIGFSCLSVVFSTDHS